MYGVAVLLVSVSGRAKRSLLLKRGAEFLHKFYGLFFLWLEKYRHKAVWWQCFGGLVFWSISGNLRVKQRKVYKFFMGCFAKFKCCKIKFYALLFNKLVMRVLGRWPCRVL